MAKPRKIVELQRKYDIVLEKSPKKWIPERKAAVVAALRSGDFEQGRGRLKTEAFWPDQGCQHCCLGVISSLAGADAGLPWAPTAAVLSKEIYEWLTSVPYSTVYLDDLDPFVGTTTHGNEVTAIHMNDALKMSFEEIAEVFDYVF